jgi:hypothetical protein
MMTYTGLNQQARMEEKFGGGVATPPRTATTPAAT